MKLQMKKIVSLVLLAVLVLTSLGIYTVSEAKDNYLIMKSNNEGEYEISTAEMTSSEAVRLRDDDGVVIVEKDGIVTGSANLDDTDDQLDFDDISDILENKESHRKYSDHRDFDENDTEWNMQQINADNTDEQSEIDTVSGGAIKVAIIDSGVDYSSDTDVYLRKNFIPDQDDISIIYEDLCGHGTSVAGIVAAKDNDEGITGINSNVVLYSAKVLDSDFTAPVSRVVEAIYWAIDEEVNIINISFGTTTNSAALKKAIQDAYNAGILIIAAAGNDGTVEYPAAYDEVMAVGSVDSEGKISDFSPADDKIELVAPGELIKSTGDFGGVSVHSGTSLAAPHVTGVASVLWQKDTSVSASFIRALLDASANLYSDSNEYGYGLVDLDYALEIYDDFKAAYTEAGISDENLADSSELAEAVTEISDNSNEIAVFDDNTYVEGSWDYATHEGFAEEESDLTSTEIKAIKAGATANDRFIGGMGNYPQWHGYYRKIKTSSGTTTTVYKSNYMASYIFLTKIAKKWTDSTSTDLISYEDPSQPSYMSDNDYGGLTGVVEDSGFNGTAWSSALIIKTSSTKLTVNNKNIRYFLYGTALHSATDLFAHSTFTAAGEYINHTAGSDEWDEQADETDYIKNRVTCASYMATLLLAHAEDGTVGSVLDFYKTAKNAYADDKFYIKYYSKYAEEVSSYYYEKYQSTFDSIDLDEH